jgi:CheY-like chemotaxis protein
MKKVIMPEDVRQLLEKERSFLNRSNVRVLVAGSNEEILDLHRTEKADLIIAHLTTKGMTGGTLCSLIRNEESLRRVSILLICSDGEKDIEQCSQCGANAFVTSPINVAVVLQEAWQLLQVPPRSSCRIPVKLRIEGTAGNRTVTGVTENISTSGILFRSSSQLYEGDTVLCSFSMDGSTRLTVTAEIVRVIEGTHKREGDLFGARFSSLSDSDLSAIRAFVEENCKD